MHRSIRFLALCISAFMMSGAAWGQLSGDYYIPQGGNPQGFATFAAAITAVNASGCSGTVNLLIDDNLAEIGASLLITRSDLTTTNRLFIKPAPTKTPIVTITGCTNAAGANQYAGFTLSGASYVTIDGSNNGSTSRDLSFVMNDGTNGRDGIVLYGNCDNVTIKNVKVRYTVIGSTSTGRGIYVNGQATGAADYCTIDNCEIGENLAALVGPPQGIGFTGSSTSSIYCSNGVISNNVVYANIRGVNLFWHNGSGSTMNVFGNTISVLNPPSGNAIWGILNQNYNGACNFYGNRIQTMVQKSTGTQGVYGFGTLNGVASSETNLHNNFLGGAFDHTGSGIPSSIDAISFQDAPASAIVRVYNNTAVLNNMTKTASSRMTAMRYNPASGSTFDIKNNIFINNKDNAVAFGVHYGGGATATFTSDYNSIYVSGSTAFVGYYNSATRQTLSNWKSASSQDVNSVSGTVSFAGATDFHVDATNNNCWNVNGRGIAIAAIGNDIDGNARSTTVGVPTDIGADEFTPDGGVEPAAATMSGTIGDGITTDFASAGRKVASIVWHGSTLPTTVTVKYYPGVPGPGIPGGTEADNIKSYWNITANVTSGLNYDLAFFPTQAEMNGMLITSLKLSKRNTGANWWGTISTSGSFPWATNGVATDPLDPGSTFSDFTLTNGTAPLPIQLSSFTGSYSNNAVRLAWTTISEINNYGFFVEKRRAESGEQWIEIPNSFIRGNGTTNQPHHYSYIDHAPQGGSLQYRLRQVDLDGSVHFTEPISISSPTSVKETAPIEFSLKQNYPNPFNPETNIKFSVDQTGRATLELYNMLGQKVATLFDDVVESGVYHTVKLNGANLASGMYLYRLTSGKKSDLKKLLLLK